MRFLLCFSLPLLLILGSFVSIDAAPQSVFKPVPPWSTHKSRLKRSFDDYSFVASSHTNDKYAKRSESDRIKRSNDDIKPPAVAGSDLDSLSFDELEQRYAKDEQALKESNATLTAARAAWQQKESDAADLRKQYEVKKTEWEAMDAAANKEKNERDKTKAEFEAVTKAIQLYTTASKQLAKMKTDLEKANEKLEKITDAPTRKPVAERELDDMDSSHTCETLHNAIEPARESAEGANGKYNEANDDVTPQQKVVDECTIDCEEDKNDLAYLISKRDTALGTFKTANGTYTTAIVNYEKCAALKREVEELSGYVDNNADKVDQATKLKVELEQEEIKQQAAVDAAKPSYDAATSVLEAKKAAYEAAKAALRQNPKVTERRAAETAHTELKSLEETRNKATAEAAQLKETYDNLNAKYKEDDTNFGTLKQVYQKKKKEKEQNPGTGSTPSIAIVSVVVILAIAGAGVGVFIFLKRRKAKKAGAKPKDGQDPPNSGGAAAAPEADSQNPTAASQKPPSDPAAAAPQPGSVKSNDAPAAAAVAPPAAADPAPAAPAAPAAPPASTPPAANAAPPTPTAREVRERVKARMADMIARLYLSKIFGVGVTLEEFIKTVKNEKHKVELCAAAFPGTIVYEHLGNFIMNLENDSGNCIVSIGKKYMKYAYNLRTSHFVNAVYSNEGRTDGDMVLQGANPEGCQTLKTDGRNNCVSFKLNRNRPSPQETYNAKETSMDRLSHWAGLFHAKKYTPDGKRAGAGNEEKDSNTMYKEVNAYLSGLAAEERTNFMNEAMREHWEEVRITGCAGCLIPERVTPPSLIDHYWHECSVWFDSLKDWCSDRLLCWSGGEKDFDDTESCAADMEVDDWDENCEVMPSYMDFPDSDEESSTEVSSRSSAGGEDRSNSEGKKKRKGEKDKHKTRQEKKKEVNPSYSSKQDQRKEKKKKEKKIKMQYDSYSKTTSSTESDKPRSPPPNWQDELREKAHCHGQSFLLWDFMKRPSTKRLYYDKDGKKRVKMSNESCDQLLRRIEDADRRGDLLTYTSELIMNVLASFKKVVQKDPKYLEIIEKRHTVRIGDIHGTMDTVTTNFNRFGGVGSEEWMKTRFILLGDYVDRGKQSLDVMLYIMALRIRYPNNIVALRGNHEIYSVNVCYGFYEECLNRIKDREGTEKYQEAKDIHFYFNYVFGFMSIIARHNLTIQCHGGCSRTRVKHLSDMNKIMLPFMFEPKDCCPMANDLLWNDPMDCITGFRFDKKRQAYVFGPDVLEEFMKDHPEIQMWVRGHQVMYNGSEFFAGMLMVCIFGTSGYDMTSHDNHGSNLVVTVNNDFYFNYFVGFELEDEEVFEGKIVEDWVGKTIEEHNFYNMCPNLKANVRPSEPPEDDAHRRTIRKSGRRRSEPEDPSETVQM